MARARRRSGDRARVTPARAAAALAVAALAVPLSGRPAAADAPAYAVTTMVAGVQLFSTQQPAVGIVTADLLDDTAGYAASALDTGAGSSQAQAAAYYPGNLVANGPQLFCSQVGQCPFTPPSYPLLADASYPTHPSDTSQDTKPVGSGPFVFTPARATAATTATRNDAAGALGAVTVGSGAASVTVGSIIATTSTWQAADGVHVDARAVLHDVTVGGVLHISTIDAQDRQVVALGRRPVDRPSVTVAGVTADGQRAWVDQDGVHLGGRSSPAVSRQLARQGLSVRLLGVDRADTPSAARSAANGLLVSFTQTVSGVPPVCPPPPPAPLPDPGCLPDPNRTYVGTLTLGGAGAVSLASPSLSFPAVPVPAVPAPPAGSLAASPPGAGPQAAPPAAGVAPASGQAPQVAAPPQRSAVAAAFSVSLRTLLFVLALGSAGLFLGWRAVTMLLLSRRGV